MKMKGEPEGMDEEEMPESDYESHTPSKMSMKITMYDMSGRVVGVWIITKPEEIARILAYDRHLLDN
jgi:hypothetical protein